MLLFGAVAAVGGAGVVGGGGAGVVGRALHRTGSAGGAGVVWRRVHCDTIVEAYNGNAVLG